MLVLNYTIDRKNALFPVHLAFTLAVFGRTRNFFNEHIFISVKWQANPVFSASFWCFFALVPFPSRPIAWFFWPSLFLVVYLFLLKSMKNELLATELRMCTASWLEVITRILGYCILHAFVVPWELYITTATRMFTYGRRSAIVHVVIGETWPTANIGISTAGLV